MNIRDAFQHAGMIRPAMVALGLVVLVLPLSVAENFSNPLCGLNCDTPDPWIQMVGNTSHHYYYWMYTHTPLVVRRSTTLAGLGEAPATIVWNGDSGDVGFWAPELHHWPQGAWGDGRWYIYCVFNGSRIQVLEGARAPSAAVVPDNGRLGPFVSRGFVADGIDPNVLHHPDGRKFLVWKGDRMLLAELASPWRVAGPVLELPLFKCQKPGLQQWYEAPATWVQAGRVWLMYSRCNTGPDYEVMLAYAELDADLLSADSWRHFSDRPVIVGNGGDDTGPGHNGWFASPDGSQTWLVYHATAVGERGRSSRAMRLPFNSTGWPIFSTTPAVGTSLLGPTGE